MLFRSYMVSVSEKFNTYAESIQHQLTDVGLRVQCNLSDDRVGYKIREASLQKIPFAIVVGEKVQSAGTVNVRSRDEGELGEMQIENFLEAIGAWSK